MEVLMKTKKILAALLAVTVGMGCLFAKSGKKAPKIDRPNAIVLSRNDVNGKFKDNVRFVSESMTEAPLMFKVYFYNEKTENWFVYGTAVLKGYGDTCFAEGKSKAKTKAYDYFAFELVGKDTDKYEYTYTGEHDDLYIYVSDKN